MGGQVLLKAFKARVRSVERGRSGLAKGSLLVLACVASTAVLSTAPAAASTRGDVDASYLAHRADLARQLTSNHDGQPAQAGSVEQFAVGDCGSGSAPDPDEGLYVDIATSAAFVDCDGTHSAGILTHDQWYDEDLDAFFVLLDTDRNPATGCEGFDYTVVVVQDNGSFPGVVLRHSVCDQEPVEVGPAFGGRADDPAFIAVVWDGATVGSPSSFSFTTATTSMYSYDYDFAPDPGMTQPVVTVSGGSPPPSPRPQAQARATDDSCPDGQIGDAGFTDVSSSNVHRAAINCVVQWEIAQGTGPQTYMPSGTVTRAQMASFIARFIEGSGGTLPDNPPDAFADDNGNLHEANINKLASAGIVSGQANGSFGPSDDVNRAQMATFIGRAVTWVTGQPLPGPAGDYFGDDDGSVHEANINQVAAGGITTGYGEDYRPAGLVTRDQMASFLSRGLDIVVEVTGVAVPPSSPPPASPDPASSVTPGAYCSPAGSTGTSSMGQPMTCSSQSCDGIAYDSPRWRKTTC